MRWLMLRTLLTACITVVAVLIGYFSPSQEDLQPHPTDATLFPSKLLQHSLLGDRLYDHDQQRYAFGRWKQPVKDAIFHVDLDWRSQIQTTFQMKHWHYVSVNTERFFIGMAIVKLGYANDAFVYLVDKTSEKAEKFEFTGRLPGNIGLTFAPSSIDDKTCTSFHTFQSNFVSICFDSSMSEWVIQANVTMTGSIGGQSKFFAANMRLKQEEALALLFPLGNDMMRPAYVHKGAGSPVRGSFNFGANDSVDLAYEHALGATDWTRSLALRCTRWYWASTSFKAKITTTTLAGYSSITEDAFVGINFSRDVYDIDGESQENAIWINGKVYPLRGVTFTLPAAPLEGEWTIQSIVSDANSDEFVNLQFSPLGSREDHTHLMIVVSDFVQPYGTFQGTLRFVTDEGASVVVEVQNAFGVVEKHFAVW